jgi:hypothetical protein
MASRVPLPRGRGFHNLHFSPQPEMCLALKPGYHPRCPPKSAQIKPELGLDKCKPLPIVYISAQSDLLLPLKSTEITQRIPQKVLTSC